MQLWKRPGIYEVFQSSDDNPVKKESVAKNQCQYPYFMGAVIESVFNTTLDQFKNSTFGVRISWWGQAFVIDIIEAFFVSKGLDR
ncbi:hypothetical protein SAMN02746065_11716 [Desulfocicer vacuolatum DSM 3385]|uniref:Uncharacterized protein n=1 Tax=Desulfocicer vacuolatum DSM 3385 TaxID=1121400 RepID=A0A1W2DEK4_9BACT|nr:hypothetical protein [Desulfocicer vacuolatum]SMC95486.1 hypothetical protein SAMN02746065_11716 [Desulfocicer vacuolatum DSM 3385]